MKIVVVGCGNVLAGDDGAGIEVVRRLKERGVPDGVTVVDAGTPGLDLLDLLVGYDKAVIVDAVAAGEDVGKVVRVDASDIPAGSRWPASAHGLGIGEALELGRVLHCEMPEQVVVIGIQVREPERWTVGLSPPVQRAVNDAVRMVLAEIGHPDGP